MKQLNHFMTRFSFLPGMNYKQFENYIKEDSQYQHVLNRAHFINLISCIMIVGIIPSMFAWLLNVYSKKPADLMTFMFSGAWVLTAIISFFASGDDFFANNETIKKVILFFHPKRIFFHARHRAFEKKLKSFMQNEAQQFELLSQVQELAAIVSESALASPKRYKEKIENIGYNLKRHMIESNAQGMFNELKDLHYEVDRIAQELIKKDKTRNFEEKLQLYQQERLSGSLLKKGEVTIEKSEMESLIEKALQDRDFVEKYYPDKLPGHAEKEMEVGNPHSYKDSL